MKKMNVMIACDNMLRELGEMTCDKFLERRKTKSDEVYYVTADGKNIQEAVKRMFALYDDSNIFVYFSEFLASEQIKKIMPCKHLFTAGFVLLDNTPEREAFETGFEKLKRSKDNLLLVKFGDEEKEKFMLVYPEKTYKKFSGLENAIDNFAETILKRENVSHAQSIQESENAEVPDKVFLKFQTTGKFLFKKGLLPVVEGGTYGNFSLLSNGKMYITGRGADKGNLKRENICRINRVLETQNLALESARVYAKIYYSGATKPSIDTAINHAVMQEIGCQATIHVHTDKVFADVPQTSYNYPCGTREELADILKSIRDSPNARVIQQYKHGLIAVGNDFDDCMVRIERLFAEGISARKINKNEVKEKEFREWEKHYKKNAKGKNVDLDIYDLDNLYVIQKGEIKVGLLYLKKKNRTLYFIFYSLSEFTRKKLGLGEGVIDIVSKIAKSEQCQKIGVLTTKECNVIPYYEKKGFRISSEDPEGSVWMVKEI